jgi:hypothetical protein
MNIPLMKIGWRRNAKQKKIIKLMMEVINMGGYSSSSGPSDYDWGSSSNVTKKSAKSYAQDDDRTYDDSLATGIQSPAQQKDKILKTNSDLASLIMLDVTGSMKDLPDLIIKKMATLYHESNAAIQGYDPKDLEKDRKKAKSLENKLEMAIIAVRDSRTGDDYPIQTINFSNGPELVKNVNRIATSGGGGNGRESYDLAAYHMVKNVETPNVPANVKPLLVIIGDEGFYDTVKKAEIKRYIGDSIPGDIDGKKLMQTLANKYDVFMLRPELSYDAETYSSIHKQWVDVLGEERVMKMNDATRIVDCIIALHGYVANNMEGAEKMLKRRQTPEQVKEVLKTLHPLLAKGKEEDKK